jgi:[ribosomal protein S18]-alanine N-acetyltransferase
LRAFDQDPFPIALEPLDGELALAMADIHSRSFPRPWSAADLRRLAETSHCHGIAARCGTALTGFIIISAVADEAEILTLAVDEAWRRRGIAGALIDEAIAEAVRRGARVLLLEVGVQNIAAQALYAKSGFAAAGRRKNYYKGPNGAEDALLMRREIAPVSS